MRSKVSNALKLLAEERRILLGGRIENLGTLDSRRTRVVEALEAGTAGLSLQDLEKIRGEAMRNQQLLKAGIEGIHAAQTMLAAHRTASEAMGVYTDSGQRLAPPVSRELNPRGGRLEQF